MKTRINRTAKDGRQFEITIRLDDECHNGHQDFSITGSIYEKEKVKIERNRIGGGAIGDHVAEAFPELAIFNDLHLCDYAGIPMYAVENGFYHVKRMGSAEFCKYFRCTETEYNTLKEAENTTHFAMMLCASNILQRWSEQAQKAIAMLEEMTGEKFVNTSHKSNFNRPTEEQKNEFERLTKEGYFTAEQKEQRKKEKIEGKIQELKMDLDKKITSMTLEFDIKSAVLRAGLAVDNFIFYNHIKKGVFNWLDYEEKITPEQLKAFTERVKFDGVTFEMK